MFSEGGMAGRKKKIDPNDMNDIRNYTEIDEYYFDELYAEYGNKNGMLKMADHDVGPPKYYVFTEFLTSEEDEEY